VREAVKPLHVAMLPPRPGDWLETNREPGQTLEEYLAGNPTTARGARRTLYVQPLGEFTDGQRRVVGLAADYMSRFFGLPVKVNPDLPLSLVPASERRVQWGVEQIRTGYVLMDILRPRLPEDAAALIAFTASDLYPDETMNFVFGQASLVERVGVWSIQRFGDPEASSEEFRRCLRRTMKLATHETGHMFSVRHCTLYECNMNGSNHIEETDRHPADYCPECVAKLLHATRADARTRYTRLADFCQAQGLRADREFFARAALRLTERGL
jgi:archaemetzincin